MWEYALVHKAVGLLKYSHIAAPDSIVLLISEVNKKSENRFFVFRRKKFYVFLMQYRHVGGVRRRIHPFLLGGQGGAAECGDNLRV